MSHKNNINENWKDVWSERNMPDSGDTLNKMLRLDGMDTGFGSVENKDWEDYVNSIIKKCRITPESQVFEIGCGSGAFLYPMYQQSINVSGLDFSQQLITYAKSFMPKGNFYQGDATQALSKKYSHIVSSGVFMYFTDLSYAKKVLENCLQYTSQYIAILDVPDIAKQAQNENIRESHYTKGDYQKDYDNLQHLYYSKSWFTQTLANLGVNNIEIVDQNINGYKNSEFRFNIFINVSK